MADKLIHRAACAIAASALILVNLAQAAPKVNYLFPAGAQRGGSVEVIASGEFPKWPAQLWASSPGITATAEKDKGKFKITVADDVPHGVHWLRVYDEEGASTPRPFVVGNLPEVEEKESNNSPDKAQAVPDRVTINGKLGRGGDVDGFAVTLAQGQTLVASLQGNTDLGTPMDAVLQICEIIDRPNSGVLKSTKDAFLIEQIDDVVGLDPRLAVTVERSGTFLVRVFAFPQEPNSTIGFAGGDNYVYRLTITTGPFVDHARPIAIQVNVPTPVELSGWNLSETQASVTLTGNPQQDRLTAYHPDYAGSGRVDVSEVPTLDYRAEPEGTPKQLPIPSTVTGRLERSRQRDEFSFTAKKGTKLRLRVESRTLGFLTDPVLRVTDAAGKTLAENDDQGRRRSATLDPSLEFTPPADGEYRVSVRDLHGSGNSRNVYRLTIEEPTPTFELTLSADSTVVSAGKTVEVPVTIERNSGFADSIEISAVDLPAGISAQPVVSEKDGASAKSVKLVLQADAAAEKFAGPIKVVGVAKGKPERQFSATYPIAGLNAERNDLWLTVKVDK